MQRVTALINYLANICIPINVCLILFGIFINSSEIIGIAGASLMLILFSKLVIKNEK